MPIDKELLSILVCPACKGEVGLDNEKNGIVCVRCSLLFPIKDGIPVMITEEAQRLEG